jgi:ribosomal protein S18 acetylase RimI-like enzyme
MDKNSVLTLFHRQLRRDYRGDGSRDVVEQVGNVRRQVDADGGWAAVIWSELDELTADAAIADQVAYFKGLGREFEWKLYSHDRPADLGARLAAAGLVPDEAEALMVAQIDELPTQPVLPEGVRIERVTDEATAKLMLRTNEEAFGRPSKHLGELLSKDPASHNAIVVMAGDVPVCSARVEFHEGTEFASLWGGGTSPQWRGRGIYRATIAYRARLAAELGYRYLQVDASDESRPILGRLGFEVLSTTTPYNYEL